MIKVNHKHTIHDCYVMVSILSKLQFSRGPRHIHLLLSKGSLLYKSYQKNVVCTMCYIYVLPRYVLFTPFVMFKSCQEMFCLHHLFHLRSAKTIKPSGFHSFLISTTCKVKIFALVKDHEDDDDRQSQHY